jgi:hypothetical protein
MTNSKATTAKEFRLSRRWQWLLLVPVTVHLLAVFSEPFHFSPEVKFKPRPTRRCFEAGFILTRNGCIWITAIFFFAPNPGPGHLLRISASDDLSPRLSNTDSKRTKRPLMHLCIYCQIENHNPLDCSITVTSCSRSSITIDTLPTS